MRLQTLRAMCVCMCACVYVCVSVYARGCSLNVINSVLLFKMVSFAGGVVMYILGGEVLCT